MSPLSSLFASLMMALNPPAAPAAGPMAAGETIPVERQGDDPMAVWQQLSESFQPPDAGQVRIEQRIIWRIAPKPGPSRQALTAIAPQPNRMVERRMGDCVPMNMITGGRAQSGSRLLLFLRDRRLVAADLEKACSARDFYSGFYVDKPDADGQLCADRDRILARSGARCEISRFRLLVADD